MYAPLNIPDGQNIYGHKPTEPVYNVLDNSASRSEAPLQSGPVGIEQPVYNILVEELPNHQEDTLQSGPVSIEQPVYNILEELAIDREKTPFGTDPVYNVLEANGQDDAESSGDNGSLPSEGKIHNPLEVMSQFTTFLSKTIIKRPTNWQIWRQSIFLSWIELNYMLYWTLSINFETKLKKLSITFYL